MDNNIYIPVEFNLENARILLTFDKKGFENPFKFDFMYHFHPNHEFFFAKIGDFIIKIDGEDYFIKSGNFIIVPAGASHTVFWQSENAQIAIMQFEFYKNNKKNSKIEFDIFGLLNTLISHKNKPYIFGGCSNIIKNFESLSADLKNVAEPLRKEYLNHAAILFAIKIICYMGKVKSAPPFYGCKNDKINDDNTASKTQSYTYIIENYINDLPNKKVSLTELTAKLHLSKSQTIRLLHQIYNAKFSDIVLNTRIHTAQSMISDTDFTIEQIAEKIGYTYKGFLRAFKKATGKTPSEFKRRQ